MEVRWSKIEMGGNGMGCGYMKSGGAGWHGVRWDGE